MIAFFTLTQPAFASIANGFAILRGISIVTIIACAVTISLVVAGFDLSVGANAGLAMMLSASSSLVIFRLDGPSAVAVALSAGSPSARSTSCSSSGSRSRTCSRR